MRTLRDSTVFEWFTITVILISALSVGVKSYDVPPVAALSLRFLDWVITLYFLVEIIVRYFSSGGVRAFFSRGWNVFDFLIVAISLIPIDESQHALLARLLRLFRVMRLIYFVPHLRVLVSALLIAVPRMSYVALMMFIIFYVYGAVGNLFFSDINEMLWGDIGVSMLTLFRVATLEDWTDVMYETMEIYPLSWIYYLSFIFFSTFIFLNMMIGVVINVLQEEHTRVDKEHKEAPDNLSNEENLIRIERRLVAIEETLKTRRE